METRYTCIIITIISLIGALTSFLSGFQTSAVILLFIFLTAGIGYLVIKLSEVKKTKYVERILIVAFFISPIIGIILSSLKNLNPILEYISYIFLIIFAISAIVIVILGCFYAKNDTIILLKNMENNVKRNKK